MPDPNPQNQPDSQATPLFDMSKAQPIQPTQAGASKPLFDMSKAQPIQGGSSGGTLPPDVAARHARANEGKFSPQELAAIKYGREHPDEPESDDFGDQLRVGIGKAGVSTVSGLANLANKVLPSSLQIPTEQHKIESGFPEPTLRDLVAGKPNVRQQLLAQSREELTPHGVGENVGATAENVVEWIGGEEALKGLGLGAKLAKMKKVADFVEEYPRIGKLLHIGGNALRQGTVGAGQTLVHGGTPEQAAATGVVTGGTGLALEGAAQGVKAIKNFVTRGPQVEEMGRSLVAGLTEGATPEQVAQTVGKNLADAEEKMHATYDAGLKNISAQGKSVPVPIAGSPLQQTAKQLLTDSNVPESVATSLKGVIPDSAKIEPFLKQLSASSETLTWDQMEATRQKIGETIRKLPWDSPIRPDLIKLRYAIDDNLEGAAEKAGNTDLSDQIKSLRSDYAQTKGALEERAIVSLKEKNPNAIADVLLNKQSVHNVNTLRRLIGPENMKAVEGSILDKMIQDASKNGELQGRQLFRKFNSLGPDAKQAIWGNRLSQVQQFMEQAGKLPNVVLDKIINHYAPYAMGTAAVGFIGHGDIKTAATLGLAALLRNPIVLDAALKGIQGLQKVAPAAAAAGAQAIEKDGEDEGAKPENQPISKLQDDTSGWRKIQTSDGARHMIHPEDLEEAKRRDPRLKLLD